VLLTAERERLFRPAWQVIGHEAEVPAAGDFLAGDLGGEPVLVVRDEKGVLRAFRNACRRRAHALVATRTGHFSGGSIVCVPHGVSYPLGGGDLIALEIKQKSGLILVRSAGAPREGGPALTGWEGFADLGPAGVQETDVAADWKLIVEQWLEGASAPGRFLAPNQLITGATILRVLPVAPGRSRLQRLDYSGKKKAASARLADTWVAQQVELAESTQTGLAAAGEDFAENGPVSAALAEFRGSIAVLLPHLSAT
jgi:nitrite reductase/ring-hydroxylating ferredoxin subunit